jgi:hypothetical protein
LLEAEGDGKTQFYKSSSAEFYQINIGAHKLRHENRNFYRKGTKMKTTKILTIWFVVLCITICLVNISKAASMGTAFTYQGHLYDANHVANNPYDFQFTLYDANGGGTKKGNDVNIPDVDVIDGYFTVELDFGGVFDGNERWLQIGVRPGELGDPNVYTTLSPRQEITPVPYALYALNSDGNISAGSVYKIGGNTVLSIAGTENTFIGVYAGASNSSGSYNTFSGYYAGYLNTSGHENTFSGYEAGRNNTTGAWNTFSGNYAGYSNTIGGSNTFSGVEAGYSNTTGLFNTFSGYKAGRYNTTGHENTFSGRSAGWSNTTGSYNTFLGSEAGHSSSTGSGSVFIGNQAGFNETGSNKLYIANSDVNNLIYGDFNTGRVGIGMTSPAQKLHVSGNAQFDKSGPEVGRLILNTVSRNDPGRYGIVFANNQLAPFLGDDTQDQTFAFLTGWSSTRNYSARLQVHGRATSNWGCYIGMSHDGNDGLINTDVGNIVLSPALNVGIGTTNPARKLHISDVMRLQPRATAPSSPAEGDIYMDSTTHKLMVYDGTVWRACW